MGLRLTNGDESPPGLSFRAPFAPEPALHSRAPSGDGASGAGAQRGICFLMFFSQKQIPRRYAPRNDRAVG
jgi:hypothetical protein